MLSAVSGCYVTVLVTLGSDVIDYACKIYISKMKSFRTQHDPSQTDSSLLSVHQKCLPLSQCSFSSCSSTHIQMENKLLNTVAGQPLYFYMQRT